MFRTSIFLGVFIAKGFLLSVRRVLYKLRRISHQRAIAIDIYESIFFYMFAVNSPVCFVNLYFWFCWSDPRFCLLPFCTSNGVRPNWASDFLITQTLRCQFLPSSSYCNFIRKAEQFLLCLFFGVAVLLSDRDFVNWSKRTKRWDVSIHIHFGQKCPQ